MNHIIIKAKYNSLESLKLILEEIIKQIETENKTQNYDGISEYEDFVYAISQRAFFEPLD